MIPLLLKACVVILLGAGITLQPVEPQDGRRLAAQIDRPEVGAGVAVYYEWSNDDRSDIEEFDDGATLRIWANAGGHWLKCRTTTVDWEARTFAHTITEISYSVGLPTPPVPTPGPWELCHLVTKSQATQLRDIYLSQLRVLSTTDTSTSGYLLAHGAQIRIEGLEGHGASEVIDKRLREVLGEGEVPLAGEVLDKLVETLTSLAEALKCDNPGPAPPSPEAGSRVVVIVRESLNEPLWSVRLTNSLRSGEGENYLDDHDHTLFVLDPDTLGPGGDASLILDLVLDEIPPPAVYILDPESRSVLASGPLPKEVGLLIDLIRANGG